MSVGSLPMEESWKKTWEGRHGGYHELSLNGTRWPASHINQFLDEGHSCKNFSFAKKQLSVSKVICKWSKELTTIDCLPTVFPEAESANYSLTAHLGSILQCLSQYFIRMSQFTHLYHLIFLSHLLSIYFSMLLS